jgi:AmiR/NasT family two-component response regulator
LTKKTQIIFSPQLARQLLKESYQIVDIQPNTTNPERTVFFFRNDSGLMEVINNYQQAKQQNFNTKQIQIKEE